MQQENTQYMKTINITAFLASVGVSLAILSIAATTGTCSTAILGQANCATAANPSCSAEMKPPGSATPVKCVELAVTNNRTRGICGDPKDKPKDCITDTGHVAITWIVYELINDAEGNCIDCNLTVVKDIKAGTVDCPTTRQAAEESAKCTGA
jgi:hypothetical protein